MSLVLTFLGGAGTVTGSKTLVAGTQDRVLVDCGLFQGLRELRRRNWEPLPVDVGALDAVVLTHAHLDHCGYLPRLCADGFRGPVLATQTTEELARTVLLDSAHLLAEEARYAAERGSSRHAHPLPLYDEQDVQRALSRMRAVAFGEPTPLPATGAAVWWPAGHILGSAIAELRIDGRTVVFSGDLGRAGHPLLAPPGPLPACDAVVVESTYGDRSHGSRDLQQLADVVERTVRRGGSVLIPAFAVDRTEIVLCALRELMTDGRLTGLPVYVDSPMALRALDVYRSAVQRHDPDVAPALGTADPFTGLDLRPLRTPEESRTVNDPPYPSIVVSASGMATGGRVLHHLASQLPDARNTVVLVGYQAVGTRGRALLDGARTLKVHGRYVPVRAEVVDLQGFSVHADADDLVGWLATAPSAPEACFVVHGEQSSSERLSARVAEELGWTTVVPRPGERVLVG